MRGSESVVRWVEHEAVRVRAIGTATRIGLHAVLILLLSWGGAGTAASGAGLQKLQVSSNKRFLVQEDGSPFFWLNDSAWFLPKVSNADVSFYLADRAQKRFTSVMITCMYHSDVLYHGEGPFLNENTDTPNATFWEHIDFILSEAEHYGLYVAITVMWAEDY